MKLIMIIFFCFICVGQSQADMTRSIFPSHMAKALTNTLSARTYALRKALGDLAGDEKTIVLDNNQESRQYYLGKIRIEFVPSIAVRVPGNFLRLGIVVSPVVHITRKPPKGFEVVK